MTDHSTARALVASCRAFALQCQPYGVARLLNEAADFIEQTLTPPEGDTLSDEVVERVARALCVAHDARRKDNPALASYNAGSFSVDYWNRLARAAIAAMPRVSPQEGLREALESLKALNQGVYDNDTLPPGQRNFAMLCIDKIDAALSASRMSEAMSRPIPKDDAWQLIETAPKDAPGIIGARLGEWVGEIYWRDSENEWFFANLDTEYGEPEYPTHWQPLPEPPAMSAARLEPPHDD